MGDVGEVTASTLVAAQDVMEEDTRKGTTDYTKLEADIEGHKSAARKVLLTCHKSASQVWARLSAPADCICGMSTLVLALDDPPGPGGGGARGAAQHREGAAPGRGHRRDPPRLHGVHGCQVSSMPSHFCSRPGCCSQLHLHAGDPRGAARGRRLAGAQRAHPAARQATIAVEAGGCWLL